MGGPTFYDTGPATGGQCTENSPPTLTNRPWQLESVEGGLPTAGNSAIDSSRDSLFYGGPSV